MKFRFMLFLFNSSLGARVTSAASSRKASTRGQEAVAPAKILGKRTGEELEAPKDRQSKHGEDPIMDPVIALLQKVAIGKTKSRKGKGKSEGEGSKVAQQPETACRDPNMRQRYATALPFYRHDAKAQGLKEEMRKLDFPYSGQVIPLQHMDRPQMMDRSIRNI